MLPLKFVVAALALVLLGHTCPAQARLGETEEQCIKRYGDIKSEGKKIHPDIKTCDFTKNGISIQIDLYKGVCSRIIFRRDLSTAEYQVLKELNVPATETTGIYEHKGTIATIFAYESYLTFRRKAEEEFHLREARKLFEGF
ncbi:hypothetical protein DB346_19150 [Verrucomicrobia bacterium LW23]|nr:hypothetical protein DB346_19150 [Verrucomicrobia bacterium LW23]